MACPFSGNLCRKLYMAHGSNLFMSIRAYNKRIYYRSQLSQSNNYNEKYWNLLNQLESKPTKRNQTHYKDIPTKRYLRELELEDKLDYYDHKRFLQLFIGFKQYSSYIVSTSDNPMLYKANKLIYKCQSNLFERT